MNSIIFNTVASELKATVSNDDSSIFKARVTNDDESEFKVTVTNDDASKMKATVSNDDASKLKAMVTNDDATKLKTSVYGTTSSGSNVPLTLDQSGNLQTMLYATNPEEELVSLKVSDAGSLLVEYPSTSTISTQPAFISIGLENELIGDGTKTLFANTDISTVKEVSIFMYNTSKDNNPTITYDIYISPVDNELYYMKAPYSMQVQLTKGTSEVTSVVVTAHYFEIVVTGDDIGAMTTIYINMRS